MKYILFFCFSLAVKAYAQIPTLLWAKDIGGLQQEMGNAVTEDASGNIYTVGYFLDVVDFDPGPATHTLSATGVDLYITKFDGSGNFVWVKTLAGPGDESAADIAIDASGNIYISGAFTGSVDFDPGPGTYTLASSGMYSNTFIIKLNSTGNFVWAKNFAGATENMGGSIAIDGSGNIITVGHFIDAVDFDPGAGTFSLTSSTTTAYDTYVSKLNSAGNFVWAASLETASFLSSSFAIDAVNNIYVSGVFENTGDFDPGASTFTLSSQGYSDIYMVKLNPAGNFLWANSIGGSDIDIGAPIALDVSGNIYQSGTFSGLVDFDPSPASYTLSSVAVSTFITKADPNGNFIWGRNFALSNGMMASNALLTDNAGNIYSGGAFSGTVDFNPGSTPYVLNSFGSDDMLLTKTDASGNLIWATHMGGPGSDAIRSMYYSTTGSLITTGFFNTSADMDPGAGSFILDSVGMFDAFVAKYSACSAPVPPLATSVYSMCAGSSATLSVTAAGSINWYASSTSTTVLASGNSLATQTLSGTQTYYVDATMCALTSTRTAITVTVNPNCQDVWPGDANSDGIVDNTDVLELGLHFTQSGPTRASTSNAWQSYFANNWTGTISNGKNVNHSDCNGDGTINSNDTLAIFTNYGLTHTFKPAEQTVVNPQLSIVPDQNTVTKGTWGTSSVFLGEASAPITNINGLAFTVTFDQNLIDANSFYIEYPTSFLNASNQNLHFRKPDFSNGKLYTATTHTLTNNVSGNGKIAVLHYKIKSNLSTDEVLNIGITQAKQSKAGGVLTPLTVGTATVAAIGASVGMEELSNGNSIGLYPNPANSTATIQSSSMLQKVEVLSLTGQVISSETISGTQHQLDLAGIANGVYFVNIYSANQKIARKKLVVQH